MATGGFVGKKQPLFTSNIVLFSPFTTGPKCPQGGCFETRYVHKKVRAGCAAKNGSKFDNYCSSQKRQRGTCLCTELIQEICQPQKNCSDILDLTSEGGFDQNMLICAAWTFCVLIFWIVVCWLIGGDGGRS